MSILPAAQLRPRRRSRKGSVRDLGSIFHKAGEFYGRCGFAPLRLDAPADLVSWPVPPLKAKTTAAALVQ